MKKVIALVGASHQATDVALAIGQAYGTNRQVIYRVGPPDPFGRRKIAFGPIPGQDEDRVADILDVRTEIETADIRDCRADLSIRGILENELDGDVVPDLVPYQPPTAAPQPATFEVKERPPVATAPPQVTEPPVEPARPAGEKNTAENFRNFLAVVGRLNPPQMHRLIAEMMMQVGGVSQTQIGFPDGSRLVLSDGEWETQ